MTKSVLITDTECYRNHWSIGMKRVEDGKIVVLRKDEQNELDRERLRKIVVKSQMVTFNGMGYDRAMIWGAIYGLSNDALKELSDAIIVGNTRWWETCELLGDFCPEFRHDNGTWWPKHDFIDLIEPQPNAFASLKTLNGRLHGPTMRDLPYEPDRILTPEEQDEVVVYMKNDLDATHRLFDALKEPMELREALTADLGVDLRSKSDTQMGFAILKNRVEKATQSKIGKANVNRMAGTSFRYAIPQFIEFHTPVLQNLLERIRETDFHVKMNGKVELPKWLSEEKIAIGGSTYTMGIGGLHSNESNRSIWADDEHQLIDADVGSFYPKTIVNLGLYPPAMGKAMLPVYDALRLERLEDKKAKRKTQAEGKKIALNGFFGLTSQPHSPAYHPPMTIAITLTGQLALLMLIERLEYAGFRAMSANTDGVTFLSPRAKTNKIGPGDVLLPWDDEREIPFGLTLKEVTDKWMQDTDYELEFVEYKSLHNLSVNTYFAVKPDGKVKRKGVLANPWLDPYAIRERLMKNPQMTICSDAALQFILDGTPVEDTIRTCRDFTQFITVVNVSGGGLWGGIEIPAKLKNEEQADYEARFGLSDFAYLGKVVRYYWGQEGAPIYYKKPHESTGNFKKVSKTDGCRPSMELPEHFPHDIDYGRYIAEANAILESVGIGVDQPAFDVAHIFNFLVI